MPLLKKALIFGSLTGIFGLILVPFMGAMEEGIGLDILFRIRGERNPPSDVVIVTLDKESAGNLNLPPEPYKWPRSLHARLTQNLAERGSGIIAFDLIFKEPGPLEDDRLFVEAIRNAGNVVLCEQLDNDMLPLTGKDGSTKGELKIESVVPLIPLIAQSALATAPFPLPKVPVKVSQYWTFKPGAGGIPTLPVVTLQAFLLSEYHDFVHIMKGIVPSRAASLPLNGGEAASREGIPRLMMDIRNIFEQEPSVGKQMLDTLEAKGAAETNTKKGQTLKSLIMMYQGSDSRYLDFYGPPGTIHTISFHELILQKENRQCLDFKGKAVFVGLSECLRPEEKDGFHTTYSQKSGVDISGVEIAATAFANLLENRSVRPLSLPAQLAVILFGGLILGMICRILPTFFAALGVLGAGALYSAGALCSFKSAGLWPPLVLPILLQAPFAFFGTVLWKHLETHKERQNVKKALGYYVPDNVVDQMAKQMKDIRSNKQIFQGTCLCTDAERYTTLSETMAPDALGQLMNHYFGTIFEPVKTYDGTVSEVVGDSMIAIWPVKESETSHRIKACLAALAMVEAVERFNQVNKAAQLPTRIGLHTGQIMIGNIGAMDRYEYNPIGDIVNTTSRIEGLNKYLGTRILASGEVVAELDIFLTREIGKFILAGKTKPVVVHELLCQKEKAGQKLKILCEDFKKALDEYRRRNWENGFRMFSALVKRNHEDGPSIFYMEQCRTLKNRPKGHWEDIINLNQK